MKQLTISDLVNRIIVKTGMTQGEIAKKIGYDRVWLNKVVNGKEKASSILIGTIEEKFKEVLMNYTTTTTTETKAVRSGREEDLSAKVKALEDKVRELAIKIDTLLSIIKR